MYNLIIVLAAICFSSITAIIIGIIQHIADRHERNNCRKENDRIKKQLLKYQ